ncbi:hypothetical protein ACWC6I_43425 [Streptomyces sp. NPDC001414]
MAGADQVMLDLTMDLFSSHDVQSLITGFGRSATTGDDVDQAPFTGT